MSQKTDNEKLKRKFHTKKEKTIRYSGVAAFDPASWLHLLPLTNVVFFTLHVVSKGGAAELVGAEEAEVPGHLPGDGGGQTLEEAPRTLVAHDGSHH